MLAIYCTKKTQGSMAVLQVFFPSEVILTTNFPDLWYRIF